MESVGEKRFGEGAEVELKDGGDGVDVVVEAGGVLEVNGGGIWFC